MSLGFTFSVFRVCVYVCVFVCMCKRMGDTVWAKDCDLMCTNYSEFSICIFVPVIPPPFNHVLVKSIHLDENLMIFSCL